MTPIQQFGPELVLMEDLGFSNRGQGLEGGHVRRF